MTVQRLVLDTNIWLDWLVFEDAGIAHIRRLQEAGQVQIVMDEACDAEFAEVITRKFAKKTLDARAQAAALAQCRRLSARVEMTLSPPERGRLPKCKDPDDQKFLELAFAAGANALITKDRALLDLARRALGFRILTPEEFGP